MSSVTCLRSFVEVGEEVTSSFTTDHVASPGHFLCIVPYVDFSDFAGGRYYNPRVFVKNKYVSIERYRSFVRLYYKYTNLLMCTVMCVSGA